VRLQRKLDGGREFKYSLNIDPGSSCGGVCLNDPNAWLPGIIEFFAGSLIIFYDKQAPGEQPMTLRIIQTSRNSGSSGRSKDEVVA